MMQTKGFELKTSSALK